MKHVLVISIYHLATKSNTSEYKRKIEFLKEEYQSQLFFASNDSSRLVIVTTFNGCGMLSDKIPSICIRIMSREFDSCLQFFTNQIAQNVDYINAFEFFYCQIR